MVFVTKPISVVLASLAVLSVLWNVYSRFSFSGGGSCRFALSRDHENYWLLKEELSRLESDVIKLEKKKVLEELEQKFSGKKTDTEVDPVHRNLPAKISGLETANKELRDYIAKIPLVIFKMKGSAEEHRKEVEELYDETGKLKEELKKLKSRLVSFEWLYLYLYESLQSSPSF